MSIPTQAEVDELLEEARKEWKSMVKNSGKTELMFMMTEQEAHLFLAEYENVKIQLAEMYDIHLPPLVEGSEITLTEVED